MSGSHCCCEAGPYASGGSSFISGSQTSSKTIINAPCTTGCIDGVIATRFLMTVSGIVAGTHPVGCDDVSYMNGSFVFDYYLYSVSLGCCFRTPIICNACCVENLTTPANCSAAIRWGTTNWAGSRICITSWNPPGPVTVATRIVIVHGNSSGGRTQPEINAICPGNCFYHNAPLSGCSQMGVQLELRFAEKVDCSSIDEPFDATAPGLHSIIVSGQPYIDTSAMQLQLTAI